MASLMQTQQQPQSGLMQWLGRGVESMVTPILSSFQSLPSTFFDVRQPLDPSADPVARDWGPRGELSGTRLPQGYAKHPTSGLIYSVDESTDRLGRLGSAAGLMAGGFMDPLGGAATALMAAPRLLDPVVASPNVVAANAARAGRKVQRPILKYGIDAEMFPETAPSNIKQSPTQAPGAPLGVRGLMFPEEKTSKNLALKIKRDTRATPAGQPNLERTVVPRPAGSNLPDFVLGDITFKDWKGRVEHLLDPKDIALAGKWYDGIYAQFLEKTGDAGKAAKYMRAWLVANQNIDVTGAMNNVWLQAEQLNRGVPLEAMKAGGMPNPTNAIRAVIQDNPIDGGVGQKISDFVDSAEGKPTRSWMGDVPAGGGPFVVDLHTARGTGLLDPGIINHLDRMGYDVPPHVRDATPDFTDSISAAKYESRAQFGRNLTDHLNDIKWQGKDDWTPTEVQAVDWTTMMRLTADTTEDLGTGFERTYRRWSYEAAPGEGSPWAAKFGEPLSQLPFPQQALVTKAVTTRAAEMASEVSGVDLRGLVHGTGGWELFENPAAVAHGFASREGAELAANSLGLLTQQTEVWVNTLKGATAKPKAFAVDFIEDASTKTLSTDDGLRAFWKTILNADPSGLIKGYQPIRTEGGDLGIRVLIDKGGEQRKVLIEQALRGPIGDAINKHDADISARLYEADILKARNDWKKNPNGQIYVSRISELHRGRTVPDWDSYGRELDTVFDKSLRDAAQGGAPKRAARRSASASKDAGVLAPKKKTQKGLLQPGGP